MSINHQAEKYNKIFKNFFFKKQSNRNTTSFRFSDNFIITMSSTNLTTEISDIENNSQKQSFISDDDQIVTKSAFCSPSDVYTPLKNLSFQEDDIDENETKNPIVKVKNNIFMQEIKKMQLILFYSDENGYSYITEIAYNTKTTTKYKQNLKTLIKRHNNQSFKHTLKEISQKFGRNPKNISYTIEEFIKSEIQNINTEIQPINTEKPTDAININQSTEPSSLKYLMYAIILIFILFLIYVMFDHTFTTDVIDVNYTHEAINTIQ